MKLSSTSSSKSQTSEKPKRAEPISQQSSHKFKLQLFPVDNETQTLLQQGGHNPFLELTLRPKKKIVSVLTHLASKWAVSRASHDLALSPYECSEDPISQKTWTWDDLQATADDVFNAVGRPQKFRLKYGLRCAKEKLRQTETKETGSDKMTVSDLKTESAKTVKVSQSLQSWLDCVGGVSIGQLLAESSRSKHVVYCDSFDAAIANFVAQNGDSVPPAPPLSSIWEAEETRHAFPKAPAQSSSQDPQSKESSKEQAPVSALGLQNFCWDSQNPFEFGGLSRPITGQDGPSLSCLDPFLGCSLFAVETASSK